MTDIYTKEKRSQIMSGIRSKNTKPEILLRKALFARGLRYRINYKTLPGKPDIVFPRQKVAIFVHGCFWHSHPGCNDSHLPKTNIPFWSNKISSNVKRDRINIDKLHTLGYTVIIVWECELKKSNLNNLVDDIIRSLH